jgi:hypothetical protein
VHFGVVQRLRREPTIRAGDDVLPPDQTRETDDPLGNEFGMFHDVAGMSNDARDQDAILGPFDALKQVIFVLVARIGSLEAVGAGVDLQNVFDDVASAAS